MGWGGGDQNDKESLDQKLTPQKSHARFLSMKISKKQLNDKTQQVWLYVILRTMDTRANKPQIFFWIPKKNPCLKQTTQKNTCQILPQKSWNWKSQT